ncbi:MAG: acyl-CoA desaturase [Phycisphaerales bacterium]|nr:acyl-CoA desaturase [Phycisphaerales bacterium]
MSTATRAQAGPPVGTVRERTSIASRVVTLVAVLVPPLGVLSALGILWGVAVRPVDVALLAGLYVACGLGITVGFHRLFSHRSFKTTPAVRATLAILGSMTIQGPLTQWVTDHRKHHALSDREGDPHSPHGAREGLLGGLSGLLHAHMGWLFTTKGMERGRRYGRDLYEDRLIRRIDRLYMLWVVLSLGIPFAVGYAVDPTLRGGLTGLVWGGLVRIFLFQHMTWSVNSICHTFGRRAYETEDQSRNNWVIALPTFGEGWHNNHHAFPGSAIHGLGRRQLDVSWWVIRGLERLGLAWDVKVPGPERMARRTQAAA